MESTVLSVGKSVLNGALGYAQSAVAEEVALQLGIQRDHAFIRDELEMMQSFLTVAHDKRDENKVIKTWVKQVRDVAYDVEDCLQDFAVRLEKPSCWGNPRTLLERRRVAKQMKDLRAKVEDVSQRNMRYSLIKPATAAEQPSVAGATMFGIEEASRQQDKAKVDLVQLVNKEDEGLRVVAVWGRDGDAGQMSVIKRAYENPEIKGKFQCHAWVRVIHPFNRTDFVQSLVRQFSSTVGVDLLFKMEKTGQDLAQEFNRYVNEKSYLIVLNDLSTIEEWDWIKACFPNNRKGSRIIVSTAQAEIANLCAGGQETQVSELKQLSTHHTLYAFYEKGSHYTVITRGESADPKSLNRIRPMTAAMEESQLIGREKEKHDIIKLIISNQASQQFQVISVWGMGGLGKTTLVRDIYQSQDLSCKFEKCASVTAMRPFNREQLLRSLVQQLDAEPSGKKGMESLSGSTKKKLASTMGLEELIKELDEFLKRHSCLIVLDDVLPSTAEWDQLMSPSFRAIENTSCIIVTTREENIAKHCSEKQENIYKLEGLEDKDAQDLFTKKVFKETVDLEVQYPELAEEAKLILKKCNGLPLAIVTIGGFLANQPKTAIKWRNFNEHISAELETNPELGTIRTVLDKSYDGLPYHLKSCFLYLSIFPEDQKVSRGRLVHRWTAEGYSREIRRKSAEEIADDYFMELIHRSMILPSQQSGWSRKGIDSCQVHDLIREIGISKSTEENLVFRLEEGCGLNSQGTIRHLAISRYWEGDQSEFESMVDMARIRSLTLFGKWRPFFTSNKMRMLRVLDLEDASGLVDHHLEQIGKLLHLRYLSLRRCDGIFHLPDSLGNLRQLQTLDIKDTRIINLPKTIIKLRKLRYIRAGSVRGDENVELPNPSHLTLLSLGFCLLCCSPQLLKSTLDMDGDVNRHDVCTACCCFIFPSIVADISTGGVLFPRGVRELQALHTMGIVNVSRGKAVLQDIKMLTRLRKLGLNGINKRNSEELCSALAALSHLESLLLQSAGEPGLSGCLDGVSSPPKSLQSLKLYGNLVKLPEWIKELQNLVKLSLRSTRISELSTTIEVFGKLPNLTILRLWDKSFQGEELRFNFRREAFPKLVVLELGPLDKLKSVEFEGGATPKLELLRFSGRPSETNAGLFSGLQLLPSLKEFSLGDEEYKDDFVEDLRAQLADNRNRHVLKWFNL